MKTFRTETENEISEIEFPVEYAETVETAEPIKIEKKLTEKSVLIGFNGDTPVYQFSRTESGTKKGVSTNSGFSVLYRETAEERETVVSYNLTTKIVTKVVTEKIMDIPSVHDAIEVCKGITRGVTNE